MAAQSLRTDRTTEPTERVRLRVEGVEHAIVAKVARRRPDALVVTQELPFLKPQTIVLDETGRRARIQRVVVDNDGSVPTLVIELAYFSSGSFERTPVPLREEEVPASSRRDPTLGYGEFRLADILPAKASPQPSPKVEVLERRVERGELVVPRPERQSRWLRALDALLRGIADAFTALRER
jgi:hypothetical protein